MVSLLALSLLSGCKSNSKDQEKLNERIRILENQVANQRMQIEARSNLSWESLQHEEEITKRHLMISLWYADQELGNYYIGRQMEHEWGPRWNRRNPLLILEEQMKVMRGFLAETRGLEELGPYPPTSPTENDVDPESKARISWENYLEIEGKRDNPPVWFGRNAKTGDWMTFQHGQGVKKPTELQHTEIERIKLEEQEQQSNDPFN